MAMMAKLSNGGSGQASTSPKGSALQTPTHGVARNAREIDNFFWGLEAYFGATGITDEGQKVSHASFLLKIQPSYGGTVGVKKSIGDPIPSRLGTGSRKNLRSISTPRMQSGK